MNGLLCRFGQLIDRSYRVWLARDERKVVRETDILLAAVLDNLSIQTVFIERHSKDGAQDRVYRFDAKSLSDPNVVDIEGRMSVNTKSPAFKVCHGHERHGFEQLCWLIATCAYVE